jgi:uncharacterized Zn-finger protein
MENLCTTYINLIVRGGKNKIKSGNSELRTETESGRSESNNDTTPNSFILPVHEGKKELQCKDCAESFSQKGVMNRHIESVHKPKKPFDCKDCAAKFSHKRHLKRHIEPVHTVSFD